MATLIKIDGASSGYVEVLGEVIKRGRHVAPRGEATMELANCTIELANPRDALPLGTGRKLNPAIGAVEAVQLIGAFSDPVLTCRVSTAFERFREDDGSFWGAYGERVGAQVVRAVEKLQRDPETRQATVTLWNGYRDNLPGKLDYPCTVGFGFNVRNGRLEMHTTMRSNDCFLGLPYDLFQFTSLQLVVAGCLDLVPGPYTHTAWSLHLYERDLEAAQQVHATSSPPAIPPGFIGDGLLKPRFVDCLSRARDLASDENPKVLDLSPLETWYWERLHA